MIGVKRGTCGMPDNPIYAECGLREISRVVNYYLNRKCFDPRNTSNPRPSKRELSRQIAAYRTSGKGKPPKNDASMDRLLLGYMPGVSQPLPEYLNSIGGMFPIPGTELPDDVGGQGAEEIFFDGKSFLDLAKGEINVCSTEQIIAIMTGNNLDSVRLSPFTGTIERLRHQRRHSYQKLCETIGLSPAESTTIRKLLYLNGWIFPGQKLPFLTMRLGRYLEDVDHTTTEPFEKMTRLIWESQNVLNGAAK